MCARRLVHVALMTLVSPAQIADDLRRARLANERAGGGALLFFCDLPDAHAVTLPGDAALIRCVQSGVMSMNARRPGTYFFLVRKRVRDRAARAYMGRSQPCSPKRTLHALLAGEKTAPFEAANVSGAALAGAFDAVLITAASLLYPPDAPMRMLRALERSPARALCAQVVTPRRAEEPLFARLIRCGFSLLPDAFTPTAQEEPPAAIYAADALLETPALAADVRFLRPSPPTLSDFFARAAVDYARTVDARIFLPIAQVFLLLLSAAFGWPLIALLAIALPEIDALRHPSRLPCALVRLAFLPRHAVTTADALIRRRFAASRLQPSLSCGAGACVLFGGALLALALRGAGALALLLAVSLLWLGAPLLERALSLPARERIPLSGEELSQLRALSKSAFFSLPPQAASPAHLLAACAGCMLGLLEADEAARRAQGMLQSLRITSAFDAACLLAGAQYLSERMADCDAALRDLPGKIEGIVLSSPPPDESGALAALLFIARENTPAPEALRLLAHAGEGRAMDAIFLPGGAYPADDALLALTHPHTFLKRQLHAGAEKNDPLPPTGEADRFLMLSCAALHAPFESLFLRSRLIAPFAPLLDL